MNKILLASVAVLGLTGIAAAQEAPALIYSQSYAQNVENVGTAPAGGAFTVSAQQNASIAGIDGFQINLDQNYSGL
ncbi:MAG: hypothetical protein M9939_10830 [Mesorhizobium sp.]|nr:hypothetical protein [Mesorhizobium sp.]MCO5161622.1 hypothetical protein [Mesorhizobium sp.]